ncbi:PEP-CTERM sorting domain-containing protein [Ruficoccus amylovorans]|uniref:PEP-CTERM sorting domain-containing protein n=1 Tax=Ruficoccus amylovorans TaxID=1804625 RepID=A0A842HIM7_9BACT|nr:PEP-CTERM sorting domain-containing protein [Ruficoccus amylovorans]MBC2595446.1 PEP-CTERM sorting domain-containing protein [Ruficoccus amylovorans]
MNITQLSLLTAFSLSSLTYGQVVFSENFSSQTVGEQPTATAVRPTSNSPDLYAEVVTGAANGAGGGVGNGLKLYDNDASSALAYENNFVSSTANQLSAVHISYDLAWEADMESSFYYRFSTGLYSDSTGSTLNSNGNILYEVRWYGDGSFYVRGASGNSSAAEKLVVGSAYAVDIYINDSDTSTLDYMNPSGSTITLAANSFAVYLDGVLIRSDGLYALGTGDNNLGRTGVVSFGNSVGLDYTLDNLVVTNLSAVPEPSFYAGMAGVLAFLFVLRKRARRAMEQNA